MHVVVVHTSQEKVANAKVKEREGTLDAFGIAVVQSLPCTCIRDNLCALGYAMKECRKAGRDWLGSIQSTVQRTSYPWQRLEAE